MWQALEVEVLSAILALRQRRSGQVGRLRMTVLAEGRASCGAGSYAEGGDLAAAGGYVGEAGGAEAGEEAAELAAEEIGSEVDEHVAELDGFVGRDVGKNFAADGDALLHNPGGALFSGLGGGDGAGNGFVPIVFVGFPAERDAAAAVFIAGLEHEVFALFANEGQEFDVLTVMRGAHVFDDASPGNVAADDFAFVMGE